MPNFTKYLLNTISGSFDRGFYRFLPSASSVLRWHPIHYRGELVYLIDWNIFFLSHLTPSLPFARTLKRAVDYFSKSRPKEFLPPRELEAVPPLIPVFERDKVFHRANVFPTTPSGTCYSYRFYTMLLQQMSKHGSAYHICLEAHNEFLFQKSRLRRSPGSYDLFPDKSFIKKPAKVLYCTLHSAREA